MVWRLATTDDGVAFVRKASRVAWVPERVELKRTTDPLAYRSGLGSWPEGTKAKADELDTIGAPIDISKRRAEQMLKANSRAVGTHAVLLKAIAYRKARRRAQYHPEYYPTRRHGYRGVVPRPRHPL